MCLLVGISSPSNLFLQSQNQYKLSWFDWLPVRLMDCLLFLPISKLPEEAKRLLSCLKQFIPAYEMLIVTPVLWKVTEIMVRELFLSYGSCVTHRQCNSHADDWVSSTCSRWWDGAELLGMTELKILQNKRNSYKCTFKQNVKDELFQGLTSFYEALRGNGWHSLNSHGSPERSKQNKARQVHPDISPD